MIYETGRGCSCGGCHVDCRVGYRVGDGGCGCDGEWESKRTSESWILTIFSLLTLNEKHHGC